MKLCNILLLFIFIIMVQFEVTAKRDNKLLNLSFVERLHAVLSDVCQVIMNSKFRSTKSQNEILESMKIILVTDAGLRIYSIYNAFQNLTSPDVLDITKQTKIIIHGYKDTSQCSLSTDIAKAYINKGIYNVLLVDSEEMMNQSYILSIYYARLIGKKLANLLANLTTIGACAEDFHVIGISLGAHVAGWTGKYFHKYKSQLLGQITGLDPAGPCFSFVNPNQRLDITDAKYVDVLHTNRLIEGITEPLGHADFYINGGGPLQPGCLVLMPSCSHLRSVEIYIESIITPKIFIGIRCQSWHHFKVNKCEDKDYAVLGYGSSTSTRGLYYLRTSGTPPFGLGINGTNYVSLNKWKTPVGLWQWLR